MKIATLASIFGLASAQLALPVTMLRTHNKRNLSYGGSKGGSKGSKAPKPSKGSKGSKGGNCILESVTSFSDTILPVDPLGLERWGVDDVTLTSDLAVNVGTTTGYCVRTPAGDIGLCVTELTFVDGTLLFVWQDRNDQDSTGVVIGATGCYDGLEGSSFPFTRSPLILRAIGAGRRGLSPCIEPGSDGGSEGSGRKLECYPVVEFTADLSALE